MNRSRDEFEKNKIDYSVKITDKFARSNPKTTAFLGASELVTSLFLAIIGLATIVGGIILVYRGIEGNTSWSMKGLGIESTLSSTTPGVILIVVGFIIVAYSKYKFEVKSK